MTPRRENFGIRLPSELIDSLDRKVRESGQTKTELVETALRAALGVPSAPTMAQRLAAVERRLAAIEAKFGGLPETPPDYTLVNVHERAEPTTEKQPTKHPTVHTRMNVHARVNPDKNETVPQGDPGLQLVDALFAAGLQDVQWPKLRRLSPAQIKGANLNQLLRARGQGSAAEWLRGRGWESINGRWHSPKNECEPQ